VVHAKATELAANVINSRNLFISVSHQFNLPGSMVVASTLSA
jgi:hypothetical protein